jgi:glycosyltransferase involved in cell wall biosynthesis
MLNNKTIAVVVPAYNEEKQIGMVIDSMPEFVDRIVIVNDCSRDKTAEVVLKYIKQENGNYKNGKIGSVEINPNKYNEADIVLQKNGKRELGYFYPSEVVNHHPETSRIILINHLKNGGVGRAVARGYKWCLDNNIDCVAKLDGDGQMDPDELSEICNPVVFDNVDYVKGNRLLHGASADVIPGTRYFGNSILSMLTKVASGYWRASDTQTAYTAISKRALGFLKLYKLYPGYGYPNDILIKLNIVKCTLKEVQIKPVYRIGEKSKMKIGKIIPRISWILLSGFFIRLWIKYFVRDFHPLFLLYHLALILCVVWLPYLYKVVRALVFSLHMSFETLFAFTFLGVLGFQSLLFAMWMDIMDNERLYK